MSRAAETPSVEHWTQRSGTVAEQGKGVWVAVHRREGWGRHCSSCWLSSFHPKEPLRDSWEPSKSRQCGLTSWNSAEPLSLGDPRRCPNKQKAAGKQPAWRSGRLAQPWGGGGSQWFPGAWDCGLWALWLAAGSWSLGSVQQTAQMLAGWAQPQRARAGPLGSVACTRVSRLSCLFFKVSWPFSIL